MIVIFCKNMLAENSAFYCINESQNETLNFRNIKIFQPTDNFSFCFYILLYILFKSDFSIKNLNCVLLKTNSSSIATFKYQWLQWYLLDVLITSDQSHNFYTLFGTATRKVSQKWRRHHALGCCQQEGLGDVLTSRAVWLKSNWRLRIFSHKARNALWGI